MSDSTGIARDLTRARGLDWLADVLARAGLAGLLPWWRVEDMLGHIDQVSWLGERGSVPTVFGPAAPGPPGPGDQSLWDAARARAQQNVLCGLSELELADRDIPRESPAP